MGLLKISVIVPVYQVEKYLPECIESVLCQTYPHWEMIMVDDGSTDAGPEICDRYAQTDPRIKVIHQANKGLSEARNTGIRHSTGEYISCLDGDDFWDDPHALEKIANRLKETQAEVLNLSYAKYFEEEQKKVPYLKPTENMPTGIEKKSEQLDFLTKKRLYIASACNKVVHRAVFERGLTFRKDVFSEDVEWCANLLTLANSMDFIYENFYCYRQHESSISHTIDQKKCKDLHDNIVRCVQLAQSGDPEIQECLFRYTAYQYGTFFKVQAQAEKEPAMEVKNLENFRWLLNYHAGDKKLLCLKVGCSVLGYERVCRWIRAIYRRGLKT